jgi:F-type H+-transporting ATPase subunit b
VFELGTFIFSIICFLIMFWIVSVFGFKPIAKMLEKRRTHIETQIHDAEQGRVEAENVLAEQRRMLDEARSEVKAMLEAARVRADEQGKKIVADAQAETERVIAGGRALIERERAEALNEVLTKVAGLTVELTTKLLHDHVTAQVHEDMLSEAEKRLGELVC